MISILLDSYIMEKIKEKVGEITSVTLLQKEVLKDDAECKKMLYHIVVNDKLKVTVITGFKKNGRRISQVTDINFSRYTGDDKRNVFYAYTKRRSKKADVPFGIAALTSSIKDDEEALLVLEEIKELGKRMSGSISVLSALEQGEWLKFNLGEEIFKKLFFIKEEEYVTLIKYINKLSLLNAYAKFE